MCIGFGTPYLEARLWMALGVVCVTRKDGFGVRFPCS
jgi:hypothetical protein